MPDVVNPIVKLPQPCSQNLDNLCSQQQQQQASCNTVRLDTTCLHLSDGGAVKPIPMGPNFWQEISTRSDLSDGRLMMVRE